jgi:ferredoxin
VRAGLPDRHRHPQGLQNECIGCAACIDVCDGVMDWRPRVLIYGALLLAASIAVYPRGLIRYVDVAPVGIGSLPVRLTLAPDAAEAYRGRANPISFEITTTGPGQTRSRIEKSTFLVPR